MSEARLPASDEILSANLAVLDEIAPALAQRLRWPVDRSHLVFAADGTPSFRKGPIAVPLSIPGIELSATNLGRIEQPLLLFGLGAGEILQHCLRTFPGRQLLAWERDPTMLRFALSSAPLADALRSSRLRLLLGCDLLDLLPLSPDTVVIRHPLLESVYREELLLLGEPATARAAVICEGGLFVAEVTGELRRRGFWVYPMHLTRLSIAERERLLDRVAPELVVAINVPAGLAELCAAKGRRLLCWEIDPAIRDPAKHLASPSDRAFVFTFRRSHVPELRAMGFTRVEHLPLAADLELRKPVDLGPEALAHYGAPISFVGNSLVQDIPFWESAFLKIFVARRGPGTESDGRRLLQAVLAEQRLDFSQHRVPELLARRCPDWQAVELAPLGRCASEIGAAERRIFYASRLGRLGLQVWGDPGWRVAEKAGVRYRGFARNFIDLDPIYCASRINLDIGRLHQLDIVTMRNFDVMACGGFVLAERSADLERLFEIDREVACYATIAELEQKVAHYLAHPEEARAIAHAGQRAVRARHSLALRVEYMLECMGLAGHLQSDAGRGPK